MNFNHTRIGDAAIHTHAPGISTTPTFVFGKVAGDSVQGRITAAAQLRATFEARLKEMLEKQN